MKGLVLAYIGHTERGAMRKLQPIGFFDSGSGGISVLSAFRIVMPREDYAYFGDHANLPYGNKTSEEIKALTISACDALAARSIKALVVACNTASTAALDDLAGRYPFPVLGIEPPVKEAVKVQGAGSILVMATPATLASRRFLALAAPHGKRLMPLPCPGLAEMIEAEETGAQRDYLTRLFEGLEKDSINAIALGCTHYPLIKTEIAQAFGKPVPLLDGYAQAAEVLQAQLDKAALLNDQAQPGQVRLESSQGPEAQQRLLRFLRRQSGPI